MWVTTYLIIFYISLQIPQGISRYNERYTEAGTNPAHVTMSRALAWLVFHNISFR